MWVSPVVGTYPILGSQSFISVLVRDPQLVTWEGKAIKWAALALPLILLIVVHRGSCCSVALLQPEMYYATVRCSSIMNNPVIELVPLLCLSTVYKSREAWNRHPCCSHHSHHCFIKKTNTIFVHWLVVIQPGKRILQHSWRHMDLGREGGLAVQPVTALTSLSPCFYAKYEREIPKIKLN